MFLSVSFCSNTLGHEIFCCNFVFHDESNVAEGFSNFVKGGLSKLFLEKLAS